MSANPDPFDVAALEKSLNDSAVRVSTIWVSFLIFGLYLAIAAGGTTHRQLFLETPIELPLLKIALPLVGFFLLAPVLFVIVHVYLLLQVLLLARMAAAYDEAAEHTFPVSSDRARIRQRLANTLFAQIFAGAPRERTGLLGQLLRGMAWLTLAIAPPLVLVLFQWQFLPYHSGEVTWTHRVLILVDVVAILLLWCASLAAQRDIVWRNVVEQRDAFILGVALCLSSIAMLGFQSEWHMQWLLGECGRFRLSLSSEILIDREKLDRIRANAGEDNNYKGESTHSFKKRDLACGQFDGADLRRVDFSGANLRRARFDGAELQGVVFVETDLDRASFEGAKLQGANLRLARLPGARLSGARLQGADLSGADLRVADLKNAHLQGANMGPGPPKYTGLSDERPAQLQGASFRRARLQGANLTKARLQAADLTGAQLQGANLSGAQLQGTNLSGAQLWRATGANCDDAWVVEPQLDGLSDPDGISGIAPEGFIEQTARGVPQTIQSKLRAALRAQLIDELRDDDANERTWRTCAAKGHPKDEWEKRHAAQLSDLACNGKRDERSQEYLAKDVYELWLEDLYWRSHFSMASEREPLIPCTHARVLARHLLGLEGKPCPGAKNLVGSEIEFLRELADSNPDN